MVKKFIFWLNSIFEASPLPDEIKYIVFKVNFAGKFKFVEMFGYELFPNENLDCFRHLEAQYFNCTELAKMEDNKFLFNLKYLIEECLSDEVISFILKGKSIFLYFNNKLELLFKA